MRKNQYKIIATDDREVRCSAVNICTACAMYVVHPDYQLKNGWVEVGFMEAVKLTSSATVSDVYRAVKDYLAGKYGDSPIEQGDKCVAVDTRYCDYVDNHIAVANAGLRYKR